MSLLAALGRLLSSSPDAPTTSAPAPVPAAPTVQVVAPEPRADLEPEIPRGLTVVTGYVLRLGLIGLGILGAFHVLAFFSQVTVPVAIGVLLTAMLFPISERLKRWGVKPVLAAVISLLLLILIVAGLLVFVGQQVHKEWPELVAQSGTGFKSLLDWLATLPFGIDQARIDGWTAAGQEWLQQQSSRGGELAKTATSAFGNFVAGLLTALVVFFFFTYQGRQLFRGTIDVVVPRMYREQADRASLTGWESLVAYMRAAVIVAAVDAAGVALAALLLQVPLVAALFALTFFLSFIPVVGAVAAGSVAVVLALVTHGPVSALIMLGAVVAVMQIESTFLQPLVMGSSVDLHPLAVLLGITAGGVVAGVLGALLAIPILAFSVAFARDLRKRHEQPSLDQG